MTSWVTTIRSHRPKGCNPGRFPYVQLDRDEGVAKEVEMQSKWQEVKQEE